jgi:hypothetical protein
MEAGVAFIAENGGGPGVRLRKALVVPAGESVQPPRPTPYRSPQKNKSAGSCAAPEAVNSLASAFAKALSRPLANPRSLPRPIGALAENQIHSLLCGAESGS